MYTAEQIANFYISLVRNDPDNDMTNMKLNKLLYFAQGRYLVKKGVPLFSDNIEAWEHGPVINSVYQKYKYCGSSPISVVDDDYGYDNFSSDDINFLLDIYDEYGKYSASKLRKMTHEIGSPWEEVYKHKSSLHEEILNSDIKKYFLKEAPMKEFSGFSNMSATKVCTRDEDGTLVVPR